MLLKRLITVIVSAIIILLVACRPSPAPSSAQMPEVTQTKAVITQAPEDPFTPSPSALPPTVTTTPPPPTSTPRPTFTPTAIPDDLSITDENIQLYPVPFIFSGDRVTFQIQPHVPDSITVSDITVEIFLDNQTISNKTLGSRNLAGQAEGIFTWIWDTTGQPGDHEIRVVLDGQDTIQEGDENQSNNETSFIVEVRRAGERPLAERDATWVTAETDCCDVYALTRTAAYRDLPELLEAVEMAVAQAAIRLHEEPDSRLDVFFIDRTIGQGGFAGSEMVATYVDRPYATGNLHELLVHEAVHVIDRQFAPQRTKFLAEGVAVWASGGHYKSEDLNERAAALLELDRFIPLSQLVEDFYPLQHEIGYLQAGAFVTYLIDQFGWPTFADFYSNTSADDATTEMQALDLNLQTYYNVSLSDIETEWLHYLQSLSPNANEVLDLETTIRFYDTIRRYQKLYDPSAHYLQAWLPHPHEVRKEGNPADLTRHPQSEINITLEVMFQAVDASMKTSDYNRANVMLDSIDRILDKSGAFSDPFSANYLQIVRTAPDFGYQVQEIDLQGDVATVLATTSSGIHLTELELQRRRGDWILTSK
jgi:hypothetical protein